METIELLPSQDQLEQCLEKQLKLLYSLRCDLRTVSWEHPCTLNQLLATWRQVHEQHHQFRSQMNILLYEIKFRTKSR